MKKTLAATAAMGLILLALCGSTPTYTNETPVQTEQLEQLADLPAPHDGENGTSAVAQPDRYIGHPDEIEGWKAHYFQPSEFASKGNGLVNIESNLVNRLDAVRAEFGQAIRITSGYRDPEHNKRVDGAKDSQHLHGTAVDIDLTGMDAETRYRLMVLLIQHGFTSFGSYDRSPNMLHADTRSHAAAWDYGDGIHPDWFVRALRDTGWRRGPVLTS